MDVSRFLICNLACADFMMGVYLGILAIVDATTLGEFKQHAVAWQRSPGCKLAGFLGVLSSELSVFTLTTITLERFYAITNAIHLNRRMSLRHAAFAMIGGWMGMILIACLPLIGISDYQKFAVCLPFETSDILSKSYVVLIMAGNGLAFIIIMACYTKMYCSIRGSLAWNSNDSRVAKRMALLVFTDFLCWAPIAFLTLTAAFGKTLISVDEAKILTIFVLPVNCCANPFLYAIFTKQFKRDCVIIFKRFEESNGSCRLSRLNQNYNFWRASGINNLIADRKRSDPTKADQSLEGKPGSCDNIPPTVAETHDLHDPPSEYHSAENQHSISDDQSGDFVSAMSEPAMSSYLANKDELVCGIVGCDECDAIASLPQLLPGCGVKLRRISETPTLCSVSSDSPLLSQNRQDICEASGRLTWSRLLILSTAREHWRARWKALRGSSENKPLDVAENNRLALTKELDGNHEFCRHTLSQPNSSLLNNNVPLIAPPSNENAEPIYINLCQAGDRHSIQRGIDLSRLQNKRTFPKKTWLASTNNSCSHNSTIGGALSLLSLASWDSKSNVSSCKERPHVGDSPSLTVCKKPKKQNKNKDLLLRQRHLSSPYHSLNKNQHLEHCSLLPGGHMFSSAINLKSVSPTPTSVHGKPHSHSNPLVSGESPGMCPHSPTPV